MVVCFSGYFTHETHGHLSIIAVAESGEGKGVGQALIDAVAWVTEADADVAH